MKTNLSTQPYKGTRDFYPEDMRVRNWLFGKWSNICRKYGYEEYDGPMLESFELYAAKSGEEIVNNELYSFEDKGHRKVAMRPEMTPTAARMVAAKLQELPKPIRWFTIPNLWRYEAPQRGRLREHWQLNVDIFGVESLDAEIEIIEIARDILLSYGAKQDMFECRINNRKLLDAVLRNFGILDNEDQQKYKVCKAIDKKDKISQDDFDQMLKDYNCTPEQIENLNKYLICTLDNISDFVSEEESGYQELITLFDLFSIEDKNSFIKFSPGLMRGFDYYTGTVFEYYDTDPINRRSMFGGGRYDDLVAIFNGQKIPAFGFGMGDVPAINFIEVHGLMPKLSSETDVLITIMDSNCKDYCLQIAEDLRNMGLNISTYIKSDKLDKQMKYADQKGIKYVVIAGETEVSKKTFKVKNMTDRTEQELKIEDLRLELFK
ncbi:MAG: histidine--tRNA ligase [bacterium]